jgi:hypothetical protein
MLVSVLSAERLAYPSLMPVPNVREAEYISQQIGTVDPVTDIWSGPFEVRANYRGSVLYCTGGVTVHRTNPRTPGGNGMVSEPVQGSDEDVNISMVDGDFIARVRFD